MGQTNSKGQRRTHPADVDGATPGPGSERWSGASQHTRRWESGRESASAIGKVGSGLIRLAHWRGRAASDQVDRRRGSRKVRSTGTEVPLDADDSVGKSGPSFTRSSMHGDAAVPLRPSLLLPDAPPSVFKDRLTTNDTLDQNMSLAAARAAGTEPRKKTASFADVGTSALLRDEVAESSHSASLWRGDGSPAMIEEAAAVAAASVRRLSRMNSSGSALVDDDDPSPKSPQTRQRSGRSSSRTGASSAGSKSVSDGANLAAHGFSRSPSANHVRSPPQSPHRPFASPSKSPGGKHGKRWMGVGLFGRRSSSTGEGHDVVPKDEEIITTVSQLRARSIALRQSAMSRADDLHGSALSPTSPLNQVVVTHSSPVVVDDAGRCPTSAASGSRLPGRPIDFGRSRTGQSTTSTVVDRKSGGYDVGAGATSFSLRPSAHLANGDASYPNGCGVERSSESSQREGDSNALAIDFTSLHGALKARTNDEGIGFGYGSDHEGDDDVFQTVMADVPKPQPRNFMFQSIHWGGGEDDGPDTGDALVDDAATPGGMPGTPGGADGATPTAGTPRRDSVFAAPRRPQPPRAVPRTSRLRLGKIGEGASQQVFVNKYAVMKHLGSGAYGHVTLCWDLTEFRLVAVKAVYRARRHISLSRAAGGAADPEAAFHREIATLSNLRHRNIVRIYEVIDDPTSPSIMLVMEYVEGGAVQEQGGDAHSGGSGDASDVVASGGGCEKVANGAVSDGRRRPGMTWGGAAGEVSTNGVELFSELVARGVFRQVLQGLQYLHAHGVIHGDVKPDNLAFSAGGRVKLIDFGSSVVCPRRPSSAPGAPPTYDDELFKAAGTPAFLPPEVCRGETFSGRAADVWAAGVTLYHLVFGTLPFGRRGGSPYAMYTAIDEDPLVLPPRDSPYAVSPYLEDLLRRMLCKDIGGRLTLEEALSHSWCEYMDPAHLEMAGLGWSGAAGRGKSGPKGGPAAAGTVAPTAAGKTADVGIVELLDKAGPTVGDRRAVLDRTMIEALLEDSGVQKRTFKSGDWMLSEGATGEDSMLVLLTGHAVVLKMVSDRGPEGDANEPAVPAMDKNELGLSDETKIARALSRRGLGPLRGTDLGRGSGSGRATDSELGGSVAHRALARGGGGSSHGSGSSHSLSTRLPVSVLESDRSDVGLLSPAGPAKATISSMQSRLRMSATADHVNQQVSSARERTCGPPDLEFQRKSLSNAAAVSGASQRQVGANLNESAPDWSDEDNLLEENDEAVLAALETVQREKQRSLSGGRNQHPPPTGDSRGASSPVANGPMAPVLSGNDIAKVLRIGSGTLARSVARAASGSGSSRWLTVGDDVLEGKDAAASPEPDVAYRSSAAGAGHPTEASGDTSVRPRQAAVSDTGLGPKPLLPQDKIQRDTSSRRERAGLPPRPPGHPQGIALADRAASSAQEAPSPESPAARLVSETLEAGPGASEGQDAAQVAAAFLMPRSSSTGRRGPGTLGIEASLTGSGVPLDQSSQSLGYRLQVVGSSRRPSRSSLTAPDNELDESSGLAILVPEPTAPSSGGATGTPSAGQQYGLPQSATLSARTRVQRYTSGRGGDWGKSMGVQRESSEESEETTSEESSNDDSRSNDDSSCGDGGGSRLVGGMVARGAVSRAEDADALMSSIHADGGDLTTIAEADGSGRPSVRDGLTRSGMTSGTDRGTDLSAGDRNRTANIVEKVVRELGARLGRHPTDSEINAGIDEHFGQEHQLQFDPSLIAPIFAGKGSKSGMGGGRTDTPATSEEIADLERLVRQTSRNAGVILSQVRAKDTADLGGRGAGTGDNSGSALLVVDHAFPWDVVGEVVALVGARQRSASVRAVTDVVCLVVTRSQLQRAMELEPRLQEHLKLTAAARKANRRILESVAALAELTHSFKRRDMFARSRAISLAASRYASRAPSRRASDPGTESDGSGSESSEGSIRGEGGSPAMAPKDRPLPQRELSRLGLRRDSLSQSGHHVSSGQVLNAQRGTQSGSNSPHGVSRAVSRSAMLSVDAARHSPSASAGHLDPQGRSSTLRRAPAPVALNGVPLALAPKVSLAPEPEDKRKLARKISGESSKAVLALAKDLTARLEAALAAAGTAPYARPAVLDLLSRRDGSRRSFEEPGSRRSDMVRDGVVPLRPSRPSHVNEEANDPPLPARKLPLLPKARGSGRAPFSAVEGALPGALQPLRPSPPPQRLVDSTAAKWGGRR